MAIKVANTTVIDDSKNAIVNSITFADATVQTTAAGLQGSYQKIYSGGSVVKTLNNPNAYGTALNDIFGRSVAISGNYAIVGADEDDTSSPASGKAYIFNVATGQLLWTLDNPNVYSTPTADNFGYSVAISGNYAIVGAYAEDEASGADSGKAYIFNVTTGQLLWTLNNPNAYSTSASDFFGYSVAISGNCAIVSAYGEDDAGGSSSGKAYIFNVATGQLLWTLDNPNAYSTSVSDFFGASVAISGNYAIIGVPNEDDAGGSTSGKAYIYNMSTGALLYTLDNPNPYGTSSSDYFGTSVAISDNYAIVGAYREENDSGKAYIYNVTTGALVKTLNNPDAYTITYRDYFGYSVAISGNYAIVGAHHEGDSSGDGSGKAYIFNVTTGTLVKTLNNPNAYSTAVNDNFGQSVAISGNYAIVGVQSEGDAGGAASGKAYIFAIEDVYSVSGIQSNLEKLSKPEAVDNTPLSLYKTLNNPNAFSTSAGDRFGWTVKISGNYAIVGTYSEDDAGGADSGKVYIYNVTTGALLYTLNNPNAFSTSAGDYFGHSVAISGNYVIVGALNEDDASGTGSGKAYIYNVTTGALLYTLDNPNPYETSTFDSFGNSVAISGNYAIVGAYGEDDATGVASGKAYIYNVTTGALLYTLNDPNAYSTSATDYFGFSVAISGNYAIVGAYQEDDVGGADSGKAYIFNVTTGALLYTLDNPNAFSTSAGDQFGSSVAISGNYVIVGARNEDDAGGADCGKAYIYNVTTGALFWTLNDPNAYSTSAFDSFGNSVAIFGNYAIVGAYYEGDAGGAGSGKAYIYNVTTGALLYTLNNPNAYSTSAGDYFGLSVAISGNYAIVSAHQEDDVGGNTSGKAYIFNLSQQTGLDKLLQLIPGGL